MLTCFHPKIAFWLCDGPLFLDRLPVHSTEILIRSPTTHQKIKSPMVHVCAVTGSAASHGRSAASWSPSLSYRVVASSFQRVHRSWKPRKKRSRRCQWGRCSYPGNSCSDSCNDTLWQSRATARGWCRSSPVPSEPLYILYKILYPLRFSSGRQGCPPGLHNRLQRSRSQQRHRHSSFRAPARAGSAFGQQFFAASRTRIF